MKRLLVLLAIVMAPLLAHAQQLRITLNVTPHPSPYLSDWTSRKETVILTIISSGAGARDVRLHAKIFTGTTLQAETDVEKVPTFTVRPGVNLFYGEDLVPAAAVKFQGSINDKVLRTGRLPSGSYRFCVQLLDATTLGPLSEDACRDFTIQSYQGPRLLAPTDLTKLTPTTARPTLRWSALSPKYSTAQRYQVNVMEVLRGQTAIEAFRANRPILDRTVTGPPQLLWPPEVTLDAPMTYAWSVRALDDAGSPLGDGTGGWAEPWSFAISGSGAIDTVIRKLPMDTTIKKSPTEVSRPDGNGNTIVVWPVAATNDSLVRIVMKDLGMKPPPVKIDSSITIQLLSPLGQSDAMPREFRWSVESGAGVKPDLRYELRLAERPAGAEAPQALDGPGVMTVARDIRDTRFVLTDSLRLNGGTVYDWQVIAYEAKRALFMRSGVAEFAYGPAPILSGCIGLWGAPPPPIKLCASALPSPVTIIPTEFPIGCGGPTIYTASYTGPVSGTIMGGTPSGSSVIIQLPATLSPGAYTLTLISTTGTCVCHTNQQVIIYPSITVIADKPTICAGDDNVLHVGGISGVSGITDIVWAYRTPTSPWQQMGGIGQTINTNALPDLSGLCGAPGQLDVPLEIGALVVLDPLIYQLPTPVPCGLGWASIAFSSTTVSVVCPSLGGTAALVAPIPAPCQSSYPIPVTMKVTGYKGTIAGWRVNGVMMPGSATATYTYNAPNEGGYTFQAEVQNGSGTSCPAALSGAATITFERPLACTISANRIEVCPHKDAELTVSCAPAPSHHVVQWQYQPNCAGPWLNATTGTSENTNAIGPLGTSWTSVCWRAIITSTTGLCPPVTTNTVTITVIQPPSAPVLSAPKTLKCVGEAITFTSSVPGGTGPFLYSLYRNGQQVRPPQSSLAFTGITDPGLYWVVVTNKNGCDKARSNAVTIAECAAAITFTAPCCQITPGTPVTIKASAAADCAAINYSWQWLTPPGTSGTGNSSTIVLSPGPTTTTTYTIRFSYTLPNGTICTATASHRVLVCP